MIQENEYETKYRKEIEKVKLINFSNDNNQRLNKELFKHER